jgi:hypothetical protein
MKKHLAALVAFALVGCDMGGGSSASGDLPGGGTTVPPAGTVPGTGVVKKACVDLIDATLDSWSHCSSFATPSWSVRMGTDDVAAMKDLVCGWAEALVPALAKQGSIRVDPSVVAGCVSRLKDASRCGALAVLSQPNVLGSLCPGLVQGRVAAGGACTTPFECVGGAFCSLEGGCPGVCVALSAAGGTCIGDDLPCADGLACDDGTCKAAPLQGDACVGGHCGTGLACIDGLCAALVPGGMSGKCGMVEATVGAMCPIDTECVLDAGGVTGSCVPLVGLGEPCDARDCVAGLKCSDDEVCVTGTKLSITPLADGSACGSALFCASGICHEGKCAKPADAGVVAGCESAFSSGIDDGGE